MQHENFHYNGTLIDLSHLSQTSADFDWASPIGNQTYGGYGYDTLTIATQGNSRTAKPSPTTPMWLKPPPSSGSIAQTGTATRKGLLG